MPKKIIYDIISYQTDIADADSGNMVEGGLAVMADRVTEFLRDVPTATLYGQPFVVRLKGSVTYAQAVVYDGGGE